MKYRIILSIVIVLICLLSVAMHSGTNDTQPVPQPSTTQAPTFNL